MSQSFPGLTKTNCRVTSPQDRRYNCIAWAAGEDKRWWWPGPAYTYWPEDVPREETLDAFIEAFSLLGFEVSGKGGGSEGEALAIYADDQGTPTHMARRLESGRWTSKLGNDVDIEHDTPEALEGPAYGRVAVILEKQGS